MDRPTEFLRKRFAATPEAPAIAWRDEVRSFRWLLERLGHWDEDLARRGIHRGDVVGLDGDFCPDVVAALLGLIDRGCIIVPLARASAAARPRRVEIASIERILELGDEEPRLVVAKERARHEIYERLRRLERPGLVLFTSGSTGEPKAAVHDFGALLEKFHTPRPAFRTLNFLLFDHWGGLNTLFHTLSNGALVVAVEDRSPENVCRLVEQHRVELLPTSPTFLNLMLVSGAYKSHDLSSLGVMSYGTEPMAASTLERLASLFPAVKLQQTYGLIELGVMRSKSKSSDSLWVKLGGEGFETRVRDRILEIKAKSAMLGYLNAPSPFTDDGWFVTGDMVEVDGDYFRILGRRSEMINVGGEKVHPTEIEGVILEMDNVRHAAVHGEKNAITGQLVCARVQLVSAEPAATFTARLKAHCRSRLEAFKVPVRVVLVDELGVSDRFKTVRRADP